MIRPSAKRWDQVTTPSGKTKWQDQVTRPSDKPKWWDQVMRPSDKTKWQDQVTRSRGGQTCKILINPYITWAVGAIFAQIQSQIDATDNSYCQETSLTGIRLVMLGLRETYRDITVPFSCRSGSVWVSITLVEGRRDHNNYTDTALSWWHQWYKRVLWTVSQSRIYQSPKKAETRSHASLYRGLCTTN